jgi:hypothetical protein
VGHEEVHRFDYPRRRLVRWSHDVKFGGGSSRSADVFRTYSGGQFVTILSPFGRHAERVLSQLLRSPDSTIDN